jgi:UPF0755 protein
MKKKFMFPLIIFLILFSLIIGSVLFFILETKPVCNDDNAYTVKINIPSGMSIKSASLLLEKEKLIKNGNIFYFCAKYPYLLKFTNVDKTHLENFVLKSGIYNLSSNMNYYQIMNTLSSGQQEFIKVSIPEGLTITKIGEILDKNNLCSVQEFRELCYDKNIIESFGIENSSLEGYLFPDTYFFTLGMKPIEIITIMVDNFNNKILQINNASLLTKKELNNAVILASIVEREYQVDEEAPLIASVFKNRLKRNIGLYSCATIEYIITEIQQKPHPEQILIEDTKIDSPYNTYKWAGLTPGPISNPGLVALSAAINTPSTNYYFFQVVDSSSGKHVFTETFEEHKINHNLNLKK